MDQMMCRPTMFESNQFDQYPYYRLLFNESKWKKERKWLKFFLYINVFGCCRTRENLVSTSASTCNHLKRFRMFRTFGSILPTVFQLKLFGGSENYSQKCMRCLQVLACTKVSIWQHRYRIKIFFSKKDR